MRERAAQLVRSVFPDRATVRTDTVAGLPGAIASVPDGMAASVLAGVNPIYGLYASAVAPIAGGVSASTRLMVITTTNAAALAAGSAVADVEPADRPGALFLLVLIAGALMVAAGLGRLGRLTRFVSYSVMTGFLTGVAVNIVLGQVADLTGADAEGSTALARALDVLLDPGSIHLPSLLTGVAALVLLLLASRTRFASVGALVALVVPTVAVLLTGVEGVARVADLGEIPRGLPIPVLPDLGALSVSLVTGSLAVAVIVLIQGVGVQESAPNPDGSPSDTNTNFIAQGVGNLASGLFQGLPVGGSVGQTALNVAAGARSRWASIASGLWMLVILVAFSGVIGQVALPTLAAVLIVAAAGAIRTGALVTVWRTGATSQTAIATTFVATLFLPIAAAVGIGVALSLLLQLNREALDLRIVELLPQPDGRFEERPPPEHLRSHAVTLLDVYGSLLYAGARTLQARLPDPQGAQSPAVVLRLRGRASLGATFFVILTDYARRLDAVGGRLYLSGVDPKLVEQHRRTQRVDVSGPVRVFEATPLVGESSQSAYAAAEGWLVKGAGGSEEEGEPDVDRRSGDRG